MVDREARDGYAELLRHFAAGRVINWDYDVASDAFTETADHAPGHIYNEVWPIYCDLRKHRMTGDFRLDKVGRRVLARFVVFLQSDLEYEWPVPSGRRFLLNLLTLGLWGWLKPLPRCGGDESVWPFFRRSDLERASARPRLLAGPR